MIDDAIREHSTDPDRNAALAEWKENGGKAVGYFCAKVPAEIIYAAGILPIRLLGNRESVRDMAQYFTVYGCYYAKSLFEAALQGKYDLLDGQVFSYDCDCMRFLATMWQKVLNPNYFYFLNNPHSTSAEGAEIFFVKELQDFWQNLLDYAGVKPGQDALEESIRIYNQLRECYRRIEALRFDGKMTGTEAAQLAMYGQTVPPAQAVEVLTRVISEGNFSLPAEGPRLMMVGSEHPDTEFYHLLESMQTHVITDDCCTVGRTAQGPVEIIDQDPFLSLSHHYLIEQAQCPYMTSEGRFEQRRDELLDNVKKHKVDGVVFTIQRFCDPHQLDYPDLNSALEDQGIPTLLIETEQTVDIEPIKNRLNAFIEIIKQ
ncbi:2-hydroxyacyl-CoA dehydratase subunit D [Thermodesulfobacteriota bacterium]